MSSGSIDSTRVEATRLETVSTSAKVKVYKTRTYLCCVVIGSIDRGIDADASKLHLEMSLVERWRSRLPHEGG